MMLNAHQHEVLELIKRINGEIGILWLWFIWNLINNKFFLKVIEKTISLRFNKY